MFHIDNLYYFIVVASYTILQSVEIFSFGSKVAGKASKKLALGTTLHHTIYTGSRFLLIFFLPAIGFLVESGISVQTYLVMVMASLALSGAISLFFFIKLNSIQFYFQAVFLHYNDSGNLISSLFASFRKSNKYKTGMVVCKHNIKKLFFYKIIISVFAYIFLVTGFFFSFLLAINYPDYRLTLSQTTAVFHGVGAFIVAFYIDPMLSNSMDTDDEFWLVNAHSILFGRVLSYCISFSIFLLIFYFIK